KATLKSSLYDIPEFIAPVFLGGLIGANLLVINAFLAKINLLPFWFSSNQQAGGVSLILIVLMVLFYRKDKRKKILKKYSQESNKERVRGNIVVAIYVALSFLLIFVVAFFKPGQVQ
ncbi:hypothetical protein, partial [Pararcticibacter amylolyticus]|uniref:hypothetical protein n=1 Tax=Pararcticibacter amylolyticus TaxID=2173175 RepID=UPI001304A0DF